MTYNQKTKLMILIMAGFMACWEIYLLSDASVSLSRDGTEAQNFNELCEDKNFADIVKTAPPVVGSIAIFLFMLCAFCDSCKQKEHVKISNKNMFTKKKEKTPLLSNDEHKKDYLTINIKDSTR